MVIDGVMIGFVVGLCGIVMYECWMVVVEDIEIDLLWVDYCVIVLLLGLCVCWLVLFFDDVGIVFGVFVVYYYWLCWLSDEEIVLLCDIGNSVGFVVY